MQYFLSINHIHISQNRNNRCRVIALAFNILALSMTTFKQLKLSYGHKVFAKIDISMFFLFINKTLRALGVYVILGSKPGLIYMFDIYNDPFPVCYSLL